MTNKDFKCITLKGELEDMGNHILLPFGCTLCGLPTVDANTKEFPQLSHSAFSDMIFEYTEKEWDITCEKCIEIFSMIDVKYKTERT